LQEKLIPLAILPGVYRNGTEYQAAGRWYDSNLVRFLGGTIQPVGGWRRAKDSAGADLGALTGVPRGAMAYRSAAGNVRVVVGTHTKLYVLIEGVLTDITPASGFTTGDQHTVLGAGAGNYGSGLYGSGLYGTGSVALSVDEADTWSLDNFGDYVVACMTEDGDVLVWDGNTANDAVAATGAPTSCRAIVVTPERFLVALGAGGNGRKVQWPSQETTDDWVADEDNTAGDFELATNGRLKCGKRTSKTTLLFTDVDMHTMDYIGGTLVYSFTQAGDNCGIIAPNAVAVVDTQAFWMGAESFFGYDGFVKAIPCDVGDYVFNDFNRVQAAKVWAMSNSAFGEVTWFYPSAGAVEIDRYVTYNYRERHWTIGNLVRTAGFDRGATPLPFMFGSDGLSYEHETSDDRGSEVPYLESGPIEIGTGDRVMRVQRLVPDERTLGDVRATLFGRYTPMGDETEYGPYSLAAETDVRLTARQVRIRLDQYNETDWRIGLLRLGVLPSGRR
jgi:hypothetical protein